MTMTRLGAIVVTITCTLPSGAFAGEELVVQSVSPEAAYLLADHDADISITFDRAIDPASLTHSIIPRVQPWCGLASGCY